MRNDNIRSCASLTNRWHHMIGNDVQIESVCYLFGISRGKRWIVMWVNKSSANSWWVSAADLHREGHCVHTSQILMMHQICDKELSWLIPSKCKRKVLQISIKETKSTYLHKFADVKLQIQISFADRITHRIYFYRTPVNCCNVCLVPCFFFRWRHQGGRRVVPEDPYSLLGDDRAV